MTWQREKLNKTRWLAVHMGYSSEWINENTVSSLSDWDAWSHNLKMYVFIEYTCLSYSIWIRGIWVVEQMDSLFWVSITPKLSRRDMKNVWGWQTWGEKIEIQNIIKWFIVIIYNIWLVIF